MQRCLHKATQHKESGKQPSPKKTKEVLLTHSKETEIKKYPDEYVEIIVLKKVNEMKENRDD